MSVFKYKDGYAFRINVPSEDGRKQKFMSGFVKKEDAYAAMIEIQSAINSDKYTPRSEITVSEFLEIWLSDHASLLAPKTFSFYNNLYKNYIDGYFKNLVLADLRANDINRFYKHLRSTTELSDNTIHHIHKTLRVSLNYAVKWDYLDISPIPKATAPRTTKPKLNYWDPSQITIAINRLNGQTITWHMKMALLLGLRQGEICALHESDFDFKRHTVTVSNTLQYINKSIILKSPKTEKSKRTIPLSKEAEQLVQERIMQIKENRLLYGQKYNPDWNGYLSVFETGDIITDIYVSKKWTKLMNAINDYIQEDAKKREKWPEGSDMYLPKIRFHDLRHSCASWLLYNSVDLKKIQEILGHSSFNITSDIYAHLSNSQLREGLDTLSLVNL